MSTHTKKTFTEFLVDQGLLTHEQMVEVLIRQTSEMPTVAEIVRESGLLSAQQIFNVFMHQMKSPAVCDFSSACHELGLWTDEVAKALAEAQARLRLPIIEILVESKIVDKSKIVSLLDHYLSEATTTTTTTTKAPVEPSADVSNFHEYYTQEIQTQVLSMAHLWKHDDEAGTAALVDKLHGLVGAARFSKLPEFEHLFKEAESSVRGARDLPAIGEGLMAALRDDVVFNLEKAWTMRTSLNQSAQIGVAS
jgi:hypothetical protein